MSTYVTGTTGVDGNWNPTTPVPQGYSQAQQMNTGGTVTKVPTVTAGGQTYTQEQMAQEQANLTAGAIVNPAGTVSAAPVSTINPDASGTVLSATTGQAAGVAPIVTDPAQVSTVATADTPTGVDAQTATTQKAQTGVQGVMDDTSAQTSTGPTQTITGQVQQKQKVDAQGNPMVDAEGKPIMETYTDVSGLDAAQIDQAQQIKKGWHYDPQKGWTKGTAPNRDLDTGSIIGYDYDPITGSYTAKYSPSELVSGSAVDQCKVGQSFGT